MPNSPDLSFDVFISYCHHDGELVDIVSKELKARGLKCFRDTSYQTHPGESLPGHITKHLEASSVAVFFLTQHGIASDWVQAEYDVRREQQEQDPSIYHMLPVVLQSADPAKFGNRKIQEITFLKNFRTSSLHHPDTLSKFISSVEHEVRRLIAKDDREPDPLPYCVLADEKDAWTPFGGATIADLIESAVSRINGNPRNAANTTSEGTDDRTATEDWFIKHRLETRSLTDEFQQEGDYHMAAERIKSEQGIAILNMNMEEIELEGYLDRIYSAGAITHGPLIGIATGGGPGDAGDPGDVKTSRRMKILIRRYQGQCDKLCELYVRDEISLIRALQRIILCRTSVDSGGPSGFTTIARELSASWYKGRVTRGISRVIFSDENQP